MPYPLRLSSRHFVFSHSRTGLRRRLGEGSSRCLGIEVLEDRRLLSVGSPALVTPANGASALVAQPQITTSQSVEPALDLEAGSVSSTAPATLGAAVPTPGLSRTTATLSQPREGMTATTVGTKAIFAGGWTESGPSSVVDIYDTSTGKWSAAKLSQARYYGMVAATVGTQAIFAGGVTGNSDGRLVESSVVDIYDASTGAWSTATLSQARDSIAATTVGTNVIFAGGSTGNSESNVVDIYDASTGAWSTATLSQARDGIAATTVGTKAVFAAGFSGSEASDPSNVVDIYDASTGAWSTAKLSQARGYLAVTTVGTKAIFAGGVTGNSSHVVESNVVDVYDGSTGQWSTTTLSQAPTTWPRPRWAQGHLCRRLEWQQREPRGGPFGFSALGYRDDAFQSAEWKRNNRLQPYRCGVGHVQHCRTV